MLKNYFNIALRNLMRHKVFSAINIFGLAIGMACSILILIWVQHELSYDRFHTNADALYRITVEVSGIQASLSVAPQAEALKAEIPQVKNTVRLSFNGNTLTEVNNRKFEEKRVLYADSSFLDMFTFPLIKSSGSKLLTTPDQVLITQAMAEKYFGREEALGKTIRLNNQHDFTVTGILKNIPEDSHLKFDFLLPMLFLAKTNNDIKNKVWDNFNFYTYLQLDEKASSEAIVQQVNRQINEIYKKNMPGFKADFTLQPLTKIHLYSKFLGDVAGHGNIQYVRIFSVVAVFILMVACINFMNLATARSARRAKEVGLRKVVGALRSQLVRQFLGESLLISFIALSIAIVLVWLLMPYFNELSGKQLSIDFLSGKLLLGLLLISVLTGLVSGSYPALFLSSFEPVKVLKGTLKSKGASVFFRNSLVVTQFVVSIVLMVGTTVVYQQLQFIKNTNLGFDRENLLYFPMTGDLWNNYQALRTEMEQHPLTENFTVTSDLPTDLLSATENVRWEGRDPQSQIIFFNMSVDENFIQTFNMQMLKGRGFSKDFKADTTNYVVNEKALQAMGMDIETAVGKPLSMGGDKGVIIGVVKDFNFRPIQQPIDPLILRLNRWGGFVVIKAKPGQVEPIISQMEGIWKKLNPAYPFAYNFLDQDLDNLYKAEQQMGNVFNTFAVLAIIISCLGLYGLAAFVAEQRTKEIGVRKVLGASVANVMYLLSKDFTRLIMLAMAIAIPLSWYAMNRWLEGFAYHISIHWSIFLFTFLAALAIALLTVSYQSIKAALANPVKSLRSE